MTRTLTTVAFLFFLSLTSLSYVYAQRPADAWTRLLERTEGWLGADGIYTVDLNYNAGTGKRVPGAAPATLFIFSDTFSGTTRDAGREYDKFVMTNHSFGILSSRRPQPQRLEFIWSRPGENPPVGEAPRNIVGGHYWLQDGIRVDNELWMTAILVGDAWKPARIDALTFPLIPGTNRPDFSKPTLDAAAPLSLKTEDAQVVLGAAICDDAGDGFLYVFGYVDRFREGSRKDAVVARVPRQALKDYSKWRFYNGDDWVEGLETLLSPNAVLARGVSTEFSVSKIPHGECRGKWLLVFTPGTISEKCAFRIGDAPWGSFGPEHVFYSSTIPREIKGVRCYNAKAHPVFSDKDKILTSYNVNRLGSMAQKPEEYRPRFVWLEWSVVDAAAREDAKVVQTRP